ncbi:MAG: serpin family protein [Verrucomicrobiae bacterium]|nr:serpin family protein [Verrucomicrobiae bacterium]
MKTKLGLLAAVFTGLQLTLAADPAGSQLAAANNTFAFKLLKQLAKDQPATNIFISPYSAATVLQMVASGAAGQTRTEMEQVLGTTGLPADAVGAANKKISESLNHGNTNVMLTLANAIWYRQGSPVKPEFIARNQRYFGCTLGTFNVNDPHAKDALNAWASDQTHGRITQIADDNMFAVDLPRLFLANAVYFKGKWSDPFKVEDTKDRPFQLRGGGQKMMPMMTQSKTFTYRRGTEYQAVRLPYMGENLAMYVFLPATDSSPEKLLGLMNGDTWQRITKPGFSGKAGTLVLPKFKLEYGVELSEPLQSLGMKTAFAPSGADFSGIAPGVSISAARQKTFVEVNEAGTEAAAVTGMMMADAAEPMPPPDPFQMIVDRPFLFFIEDNQTGTILFIGVVFDPLAD